MSEKITPPGFIIIGAQRSGTTSLYNYLTSHPDVMAATHKELHFFDYRYNQGTKWYHQQFPKQKKKITGESSPYYLIHPLVPARVYLYNPEIKLIVLLRNPVDRAYSHYYHEIDSRVETLPFEQALAREEERLKGEFLKLCKQPNYFSYNFNHFSYLTRGIYLNQLQRWLKYFTKEQLLLIQSEFFFQNCQEVLSKVFKFLELTDYHLIDKKIYNRRKYPQMKKMTRSRLENYFKPFNQKLYQSFNLKWSWESGEINA